MPMARWGNEETYCVEKRISLDFGTATAEVVYIVALQGNQITRSGEVDAPVRVTVACG
jgi:hypothetical protein